MVWRLGFTFFLLWGCWFSAVAQSSAPAWLSQIKLSGLSGPSDHRLAVINRKTFSPGEANDLKLKGRTVRVQCLEIGEDSVLVQIQDLPGSYALTMAGEIIPLTPPPAVACPSPAIQIQSPRPPPTSPPAGSLILRQPTTNSQPFINTETILVMSVLIVIGGFLLLPRLAVSLGHSIKNYQYRPNPGEAMVVETISHQFDRPHLLLNNLTLPIDGGTTQIDHVMVAETGIFVIETKHYSGWIFGDPQQTHWTQSFHRKKSRFQNPLRQNYGHVKALQALFAFPESYYHSVVVFAGDAVFKTALGPNVVQLAGLIPFLTAERPVVFDESKMAYIVGRIEMNRERRSVETDEYHINHVRQKIAGKIPRAPTATPPPSTSPPPTDNPFSHPHSKYMPKE